jgi:hypothetical protein
VGGGLNEVKLQIWSFLRRIKKEEFPGFMETCCLGTPFPRSALFLEASCRYLKKHTRVLKGYG